MRDTSPVSLIPRACCAPSRVVWQLYNVKELKKPFAKSFTHAGSPGVVYRPEYERLLAAMRWPTDVPVDSRARARRPLLAPRPPRKTRKGEGPSNRSRGDLQRSTWLYHS